MGTEEEVANGALSASAFIHSTQQCYATAVITESQGMTHGVRSKVSIDCIKIGHYIARRWCANCNAYQNVSLDNVCASVCNRAL